MAYYVWDQTTSTWVTASSAGFTSSPLTTKGDVWGYSTTDARIPVGADGDVLTADSTQALGLKWAAGGGSGVSSLDSITGAVTLVAGSNVTITDNSPSAGDITIAASASGSSGLVSLFDSTLASAAASIDTGASGIASGHGDLVILIIAQSTKAAQNDQLNITFNNDTAGNYDRQYIAGYSSTTSSGANFAQTALQLTISAASSGSPLYPGVVSMFVPSYDQTTFYKTGTLQGGVIVDTNAAACLALNYTIGYRSTAAISRMAIAAAGGNLVAGSRLVVYGTA